MEPTRVTSDVETQKFLERNNKYSLYVSTNSRWTIILHKKEEFLLNPKIYLQIRIDEP